jgi:hypothetical protein|tara:strand:+ start:499 stop:651 length:153 start_codon:yes stop_codon:yes gene_type:complete
MVKTLGLETTYYLNPVKTDKIVTSKIRCGKHAIQVKIGSYDMYEATFKGV